MSLKLINWISFAMKKKREFISNGCGAAFQSRADVLLKHERITVFVDKL